MSLPCSQVPLAFVFEMMHGVVWHGMACESYSIHCTGITIAFTHFTRATAFNDTMHVAPDTTVHRLLVNAPLAVLGS